MNRDTFNPFRRLHFYAAWFITPLLLTLTLSGIGFLFYPEVENMMYEHEFFGQSDAGDMQSMGAAIEEIKETYNGYSVSKISMMEEPYNNRVTISNDQGESQYVFLDENNQIVSTLDSKSTYSNFMRTFHSSLLTEHTFVRYLVELTACWAIFLIVSGTYMTFKKKLLQNRSSKLRFQKIHAVLGLVLAIPLIIIVVTGIPWSVFTGSKIAQFAADHPDWGKTELRYNPPQSDVDEIPWATRSMDQPASDHKGHAGHHSDQGASDKIEGQKPIEEIITAAGENNIPRPFSIIFPADETGVFTVSKGSNTGVTGLDVDPYEETTAYFDQYSGEMIAQIDFEDYGIIGKWFTWGIPLHEGHLFGVANKILNLLVCIAFLSAITMGFMSWMKRMKSGEAKGPKRINKPWSIGVVVTLAVLGILMPLFGLSVLVIFIVETVIYFRKKRKEA
ncbi:PepSY-associated TM helix domain-containing protein [[Bacillus] enclensis]|uniref:PepSY-associated TM helix domain-containing protein n=1 Tax=[Bacillus] enclensis TaxID=1402860 RepID=UPI000509A786|nr:PepSY domain-containing protein [[Bacillus] enclensis]MBH9968065.1 PepSY domain-containing protein [[Bacillus] enclensis]